MSANRDGLTLTDVLVVYDYTPGGIADSSGRLVKRSGGRRGVNLDFRLLKSSRSWLIDRIDIVSEGRPS
jgi:hypothetical protein